MLIIYEAIGFAAEMAEGNVIRPAFTLTRGDVTGRRSSSTDVRPTRSRHESSHSPFIATRLRIRPLVKRSWRHHGENKAWMEVAEIEALVSVRS